MKRVTAIITTHKREPNILKRAILSVLNQTYGNLEIIVVDDSPAEYPKREEVKAMVASFGDKVLYIQHEACRGACAARNTGIEHSTGEFIAFLDDDDEWLPEKIEKQYAKFTDDDIALVYCGEICINDETGEKTLLDRSYSAENPFHRLMLSNFIGSTSMPLIRASALKGVGGFDVLMESAQDYDVWARLAAKYKIACVAEPLILFHNHGNERISNSTQRRINGLERFYSKNKEYIDSHRDAYWNYSIRLSPIYGANGQKLKALRYWARAVIKQPLEIIENIRYLSYIVRGLY